MEACSGDCMPHINLGASQAAWGMLLCGRVLTLVSYCD